MCGIAGYFLFKGHKDDDSIIDEMQRSLYHRGPDDFGYVMYDTVQKEEASRHNLALANRRLKIIDLSSLGHQPMLNDDGTIYLVYNGEVYNYVELKEELARRGHTFRSGTDTEVIIHAYEEYGTDCVKHFNGMWGFALYDSRKNILFCSRDRFGIKPFYFFRDDSRFIFGSEIKSIFKFPDIRPEVNENMVIHYLVKGYRYIDGERDTFYKNIKELKPSENLVIDLNSFDFNFEKYWQIDVRKKIEVSEEEAIRKVRELLIDAVRIHLRSDVPYSFLLSGGIDSSSIVSIAKHVLGKDVTTFSAVYEKGSKYDEQDFIADTVNDTEASAYLVRPELGDFFKTIGRMISYHDEPVCTITYYSHWQVIKKVKDEGFTVLLTGLGGDELFAGYYDHYLYYFYELYLGNETEKLEKEITAWEKRHGKSRSQWEEFLKHPESRANHYPMKDQYLAAFKKAYTDRYYKERMETNYSDNLLENRMLNELMLEAVPPALRPDDRNSMMFTVELRVPYLDYRLVEYSYSLPNSLKIQNGLGKSVLRKALKGILNDSVRLREDKVGFNAPMHEWMKNELRESIEEFLKRELHIYDFLQKDKILGMWEEHMADRQNHMMFFWNILNLEIWLEQNIFRREVLERTIPRTR